MLGLPDAPVTFGAYPDGKLPEADTDHLVGEIVRFIREQRPTVLVTFGPEGAPTGHRDHRAISRAATAAYFLAARASEYPEQLAAGLAPHAAARLYYVSWTPTAGARPPHESVPPTVAVDTAVTHAIEHRAFLAHRTQLDHIASFERDCLTPTEDFALVHGVVQPVEMASGLFEGLGEG
jgi:LmbE family N-acetylglucosaminyl deacetylase